MRSHFTVVHTPFWFFVSSIWPWFRVDSTSHNSGKEIPCRCNFLSIFSKRKNCDENCIHTMIWFEKWLFLLEAHWFPLEMGYFSWWLHSSETHFISNNVNKSIINEFSEYEGKSIRMLIKTHFHSSSTSQRRFVLLIVQRQLNFITSSELHFFLLFISLSAVFSLSLFLLLYIILFPSICHAFSSGSFFAPFENHHFNLIKMFAS